MYRNELLKVQKLWLGSDEEFFQRVFAYLKSKFEVKFSALNATQKNMGKYIYHESIVALESVHEVLRKIENGSAPTREDYEEALKQNNDGRQKEIIDFYKKLALLNDSEFDAFEHFRRFYYFDSVISSYSVFLDQYVNPDFNEDKYPRIDRNNNLGKNITNDKLSRMVGAWDKKNFNANMVFQFIEGYQAWLSLPPPSAEIVKDRYHSIRETINQQNDLYKKLLRDYEELNTNVNKIGISVVDIVLPYSLGDGDHSELLSTQQLVGFINWLEYAFSRDQGLLFIVNHAYARSSNYFVLSYLFLYNAKIHKNSTALSILIKESIYRFFKGNDEQVKVINREGMIKKLYPNETFTGVLSSKKEKEAFRDKFLKYFLSSIFLINFEKDEDLEYLEASRNLTLNNYRFYKEKILNDAHVAEYKFAASEEEKEKKPRITHLSQLVGRRIEKDKFFGNKELPKDAISQLQLMKFLYMQQGIEKMSERTINDLMRVESFLMRLMYLPVYEFSKTYTQRDFYPTPAFAKLSLLFQQFLLILEMRCFENEKVLPKKLISKAISFIDCFSYYLEKNYKIHEIANLKKDLERYKNGQLRSMIQEERIALRKCSKKAESIQEYLVKVLDKDAVILRFIFKCGNFEQHEANKFDEMFRDYTNNLKRRYTEGFRLEGYVGAYIPHGYEHYIDATLIFQNDKNTDNNIRYLKASVAQYWRNYVENKGKQIQEYKKRQKNSKLQSDANPFSCFENQQLIARSIEIVKTEAVLNQSYVEIFQGQKKLQKLFIEKISLYYAYSPMILVVPDDYELLPRKNCLILGRVRSAHPKKDNQPVSSSPDEIEEFVEKEITSELMSDDSSG